MLTLITGGAGFIGSHYVRMLLKDAPDKSVIILDKMNYASDPNIGREFSKYANVEIVVGDICNRKLLTELIDSCQAVVNFAAETHVDNSISDSTPFLNSNIIGVQNLLDAILKTGNHSRLLHVSTDEVYGSIEEGSWNEDFPMLPNSPYSATKASGELLIRSYFKTFGVDSVITRASNTFGPRQHPEKLLPKAITNIISHKRIPIYGNGLNRRDWLFVEDHCKGIELALNRGKSGEIYNLGGNIELTNLDIIAKILKYFSLDDSILEFVPDRLGHDYRYSLNMDKSRDKLGFSPTTNFDAALVETINWYIKNEEWWLSKKKDNDNT